jgi:Transposase DDE domain
MAYIVPMYIDVVPNRNSRPAVLLREASRHGRKILKRTLANLSDWPPEQVEALRRLLRGERLVPVSDLFTIERSLPHGHVQAVLGTIRRLALERLIGSGRCRERDLVVAMIAERVLHPSSKLATTRTWRSSTLAEELEVVDADVDEVYAALDWLLARQGRIEKRLAARHLTEGGLALYDLSSSSYEGSHCPLARWGHNRDGEKLPCIAYGVLADREGRPVAMDVFPGNTGDPKAVVVQVERLQRQFGLRRVVLVGDRGLLTATQLETLRDHPGLGWISALRSTAIRELVDSGALQRSLFDETNLAEITSPEYPGERLVACFNPLLAEERRRKREELLAATERELKRLVGAVTRRTRTPMTAAEIGVKVGRVINRYKVGKHFEVEIGDSVLSWQRRTSAIEAETALDGIYVVRTSEPSETLGSGDVVRAYKSLAEVELAFRCLKGIDLKVRPIFLRLEDHVRAHLFLCMLAYYIEWHMRQAWAPLLYEDEERRANRARRDPVAPATPTPAAKHKKVTHEGPDGFELHSFRTLLHDLATLCRNRCQLMSDPTGATFEQITEPTPLQARAFSLLQAVPSKAQP